MLAFGEDLNVLFDSTGETEADVGGLNLNTPIHMMMIDAVARPYRNAFIPPPHDNMLYADYRALPQKYPRQGPGAGAFSPGPDFRDF